MQEQTENPLQDVLVFIEELDKQKIARRIDSVRDSIMVEVYLPSERWEVEFFADGSVEIEVFKSSGSLGGSEARQALHQLLEDVDNADRVDIGD